jgi:hypothetical protein
MRVTFRHYHYHICGKVILFTVNGVLFRMFNSTHISKQYMSIMMPTILDIVWFENFPVYLTFLNGCMNIYSPKYLYIFNKWFRWAFLIKTCPFSERFTFSTFQEQGQSIPEWRDPRLFHLLVICPLPTKSKGTLGLHSVCSVNQFSHFFVCACRYPFDV